MNPNDLVALPGDEGDDWSKGKAAGRDLAINRGQGAEGNSALGDCPRDALHDGLELVDRNVVHQVLEVVLEAEEDPSLRGGADPLGGVDNPTSIFKGFEAKFHSRLTFTLRVGKVPDVINVGVDKDTVAEAVTNVGFDELDKEPNSIGHAQEEAKPDPVHLSAILCPRDAHELLVVWVDRDLMIPLFKV